MSTAAREAPAEEKASAARERRRRNSITDWVMVVIPYLFLITMVGQLFIIPTVSMEDTLLQGDHVLVDKLAYAPPGPLSRYLLPYSDLRRGDIVVFRWPIHPVETWVKRVIGVPGDRIRLVNKQVYRNGRLLAEPYAVHKTAYVDAYRDNFPSEPNVRLPERGQRMLEQNVVNGEVVVPPGMYFVMGDNRDNSLDSRYWGFVPRDNIVGKPVLVWWSYDAPIEQLNNPNIISFAHLRDLAANFFSKTRWSRTFKLVRSAP